MKSRLKKNGINGFKKDEVVLFGQKTGNKLMVDYKGKGNSNEFEAVSYTHLTLPTIYSV